MEILILVWLICGILCAVVASSKGRSGAGWFVVGLLTGIFGLIAAAGVGPAGPKLPVPAGYRERQVIAFVVIGLVVAFAYWVAP